MATYSDLAHLSENDRITVIVNHAKQGHIVGCIVETESKAKRYIRKIEKYPEVKVIDQGPGPDGTILIRVGPRPH